jgi:tetratricopeptide (TPR) repeat protein
MKTSAHALILLVLVATPAFAEEPEGTNPPLFDGLGKHSRNIATRNPKAQQYFDQGLMFMFAYNHDEAVRAFRQAARLDPEAAMPFWGIALASGMNYNDPSFTPQKAKVTRDALGRARAKATGAAPADQALIGALAARYPDPPPKERADAEKAYATAMKAVWEKFSNDADVGAVYAEALMNLRPWDLWQENGKPQPETPEILRTLEAVMKLDPAHPLANHLYIHAVEASPEPGKADASAEALRGNYPALGHLLHMPSHIDIRRGRWQPAVEANRLAIEADRNYQKAVPEQDFYRVYMAHNHHMLTFAAMMQGQSELALRTIRGMTAAVPKEWVAVKEKAALVDGYVAMPLEVLKRFGRWDDLLKEPEPPEIFPLARAMRHYARGVAFAAQARVEEARKAQTTFRAAVTEVPEGATFSNNKAADLLAIADHVLEGEIFFREGKSKEAITALEKAVAREDRLRYAEPPDWFVPVRHTLGAILLHDKQALAAEKVYREDLRRWPDNGWSLHGLAQTLEVLGEKAEAAQVRARLRDVWQRSDVRIESSCFCVEAPLQGGEKKGPAQRSSLKGHRLAVMALAFSPDGRFLASGVPSRPPRSGTWRRGKRLSPSRPPANRAGPPRSSSRPTARSLPRAVGT